MFISYSHNINNVFTQTHTRLMRTEEATASATDAERRAVAERGMRALYQSLRQIELEQSVAPPPPPAIPKP